MNGTPWWRRIFGGRVAKKSNDRSTTKEGTGKGRAKPQAKERDTAWTTGLKTAPQPKGKVGKRRAPAAEQPVLGLTVQRGGWLGAVLEPSGHGTPHLVVGPTLEQVVAEAGEVGVVAIDIPMGLPDSTRREADVQTRRFVGAQASAVFTTPVRDAVYAISYGEANTFNRETIGSGVSRQAYELRRQIMEIDAWLRQDLPFTVVEVHPEASFTALAGAPLDSRRRSSEGAKERRDVLATAGVYVPGTAPHGVATDEVIDACAAALSAHRVKTGKALSFPEQPETFGDGIPAAIRA